MYNYYLRKADNLYSNVSKEDDETMASGRQFQSPIVFGKNENLKTSLFAYVMRYILLTVVLSLMILHYS